MIAWLKSIRRWYRRIRNKPVERICKNCRLYDPENGACRVAVVVEGEHYELPVLPNDPCYWEKEDVEIQQVRLWSDGQKGFVELPKND